MLDTEVEMDTVRPLSERHVTGRFVSPLQAAFRADPRLLGAVARDLVTSNFPGTVKPDVVEAVGLDPASVLAGADTSLALRTIPNTQTVFCDGKLAAGLRAERIAQQQ